MTKKNTSTRGIPSDALITSDKRKEKENGLLKQPEITVSGQDFELYSLYKVRRLLHVGIPTLMNYINSGKLGTIVVEGGKCKIPASELRRFIQENTIRERKVSLLTSFGETDVSNFFNKKNKGSGKGPDCALLLNKHMEALYGKRVC